MVIFSDEPSFQLFSSPDDLMVGLGCEKAEKIQCLAPYVKFGRGSMMIWWCFIKNGFERCTNQAMNRVILGKKTLPFLLR